MSQCIRLKVTIELIYINDSSFSGGDARKQQKLLLDISNRSEQPVQQLVNDVAKSAQVKLEDVTAVKITVNQYRVSSEQNLSLFRDNDKVRMTFFIHEEDHRKVGDKEAAPLLLTEKSANSLPSEGQEVSRKRKHKEMSVPSSSEKREASKRLKGAHTAESEEKATAAPPTSEGRKAISSGADASLDVRSIWQMMKEQQDSNKAALVVPPQVITTDKHDSSTTPALLTNKTQQQPKAIEQSDQNPKKKTAKTKKVKGAGVVNGTKPQSQVADSVVKKTVVLQYLPLPSASKLLVSDRIRYRLPVLVDNLPSLSECREARVISINESKITLEGVNERVRESLDMSSLFDLEALRDSSDLVIEEENEEESSFLIDEFVDLIQVKRNALA